MFCAVKTDSKPPPPDPFEPFKVRYPPEESVRLDPYAHVRSLTSLLLSADRRSCGAMGGRLHCVNVGGPG